MAKVTQHDEYEAQDILNQVFDDSTKTLSVSGPNGGGASTVDESTFTAGTTAGTIAMGVYESSPDTLASGEAAAELIDTNRRQVTTLGTLLAGEDLTNNNIHTTIYDAANNNRGVNVNSSNELSVSVDGMTAPLPAGTNAIGTVTSKLQDGSGNAITSTSSALDVNIKSGTVADESTFTPGTSKGFQVMGVYETTPDTLTNDQIAAVGVNVNRAVRVTLDTYLSGERPTNDYINVESDFSYATITTATTTVVKSGAGKLHSVCIVGGTLGAITIYDNTAASGTTIIPTFTPTATLPCPTIILDVLVNTGITVVTAAATILVINYR